MTSSASAGLGTRPDAEGGGEDVRALTRSTGRSGRRQARGRTDVREAVRKDCGEARCTDLALDLACRPTNIVLSGCPARTYHMNARIHRAPIRRKQRGCRSDRTGATGRRGGLREPRRRHGRPTPPGGAQDPARHGPCRGRDAAGAARHLAGPSATARPGPLRRLVVPAPRARLLRRGTPDAPLGAEPPSPPGATSRRWRRTSARSSIATSSSAASGGSPSTIARWSSCTTISTCRSTRSPSLLGVPVGTVRSRLQHAMRGLRAALEADARPAPREAAG